MIKLDWNDRDKKTTEKHLELIQMLSKGEQMIKLDWSDRDKKTTEKHLELTQMLSKKYKEFYQIVPRCVYNHLTKNGINGFIYKLKTFDDDSVWILISRDENEWL